MKPLKIKLIDHHADNEQRLAVELIRSEFQIKEQEAINLISNNWIFNDNTFSANVMEYLELNYFKRTDNQIYTKEDMLEAYRAGGYNSINENIVNLNTFNNWIKTYKS